MIDGPPPSDVSRRDGVGQTPKVLLTLRVRIEDPILTRSVRSTLPETPRAADFMPAARDGVCFWARASEAALPYFFFAAAFFLGAFFLAGFFAAFFAMVFAISSPPYR
jgi:hypothetical protein